MTTDMNLGAPEIVLLSLVLIFLILFFDNYRSKSKDTFEKLVWACLIFLFPFVGAIVYLSVGRKDKFLYHVLKKFYGGSNQQM
jgi:multisubunit Na+/H+ antiporter MnhB subunit